MSNSLGDMGATAFSFLSFKIKAIILGTIIILFFLILLPALLIGGLFSSNDKDEDEEEEQQVVAEENTNEVISDKDLTKYSEAKFIIPFANWASGRITSMYGTRVHPVTGATKKHTGIDLVSLSTNKIVAAETGVVTLRTYNPESSFGNGVELLHTLDDGTKVYTFYAHMQDGSVTCEVGDTIQQGQVIGLMGSTGLSTGDHLHFEVRNKSGYGNDINPTSFLFGNLR